MKFGAPQALAVAALMGCGGDTTGANLHLVVEVEGSQTALKQYVFEPSGLTSDGKLHLDGTQLVRRFEASGPFGSVDGSAFALAWSKNGAPVGAYAVRPFACRSMTNGRPTGADAYTETQQFFIDDNGSWQSGTDLAHALFYRCEDALSGGMGGNGESSYESEPIDCAQADRANTMMSLHQGGGPAMVATTCEASYSPAFGGLFAVIFGFVAPTGDHVYAQLVTCFDPSTARYPLASSVSGGGCSRPSLLTDGAPGMSSAMDASGGEWTLMAYDFRAGGHASGRVTLTFPGAGGESSLTGSFDLPVIRVGEGS